jgi:hypothetical protein
MQREDPYEMWFWLFCSWSGRSRIFRLCCVCVYFLSGGLLLVAILSAFVWGGPGSVKSAVFSKLLIMKFLCQKRITVYCICIGEKCCLILVTLKIFVLWHVMPHRLVEHHQHFGGICCLKLHFRSTLKMEATGSSRRMAEFHQTTSQKTVIFFHNACSHQSNMIELRFSQQSQWSLYSHYNRNWQKMFRNLPSWRQEGSCLKYT